MNKLSSRSHMIFAVELIQRYPNESEKRGKFNLVDLAGSEKMSKSKITASHADETKKINLSLTCLGKVIN
jgi:kinesin family member 5